MNRTSTAVRKQIGQMRKLFGLWPKSRRRDLVDKELNPATNITREGVPEFLSQTRGVRTTHVTRRQIVLNRHFTEIISDILANEFRFKLDRLGVSVTSIETKAWNKGVRVFYSRNEPYDEQTHKELNALVVHLRAAITERQLIGRTPNVNFVYDESVKIERSLNEVLSSIVINEDKKETEVANLGPKQLYISKNLGSQEQTLVSARFSAPNDMDNCLLGIDYPKLYDEVALKLAKGRGESSRIKDKTNSLVGAKLLFKGPPENDDELDPVTRLLRMRKFLVSQKQKIDHLSRLRRKDEILARDSVRWIKNETADSEHDTAIAPEVHHEADEYYEDVLESSSNSSDKN